MAQDSDRCAVLILSCDRYSDLWEPTTTLFLRHWPDCPWPRYLASDSTPPAFPGFGALGSDRMGLNWSALLLDLLPRLDYRYVLLYLDDFFLTAKADTGAALALLSEMERLGAAHLRLIPHQQYLTPHQDSQIVGVHGRGLPYRSCLQAGFWRKDILLALLQDGESPWQFEVQASRRSEGFAEPFLAALKNPTPYVDVLERGKWLPRGVGLCEREQIIRASARAVVSWKDRVRRAHVSLLSSAISSFSPQTRATLRRYKERLATLGS